jgi:hypothetical protein
MSKAINWPAEYLNEVINENAEDEKIALRTGSIYYDHCYYVPDEVVDIRVNHKVIRQGIITKELKLCKIKELTEEDLSKEKSDLKTLDKIVSYLSRVYDQDITPESEITVVYYRNLSKSEMSDRVDDPHM